MKNKAQLFHSAEDIAAFMAEHDIPWPLTGGIYHVTRRYKSTTGKTESVYESIELFLRKNVVKKDKLSTDSTEHAPAEGELHQYSCEELGYL
jgi:hypothetical protein